jgi:uncharacterized protein YbjT (DUF2867 family)
MQNFSEGFMLPAIRHAGVVPSVAGSGKVAMVNSGDIASIAMAALTRDDLVGRDLAITGPTAMDFAEMIEMISAAAGRPIVYQPVEELTRNLRELETAGLLKQVGQDTGNAYALTELGREIEEPFRALGIFGKALADARDERRAVNGGTLNAAETPSVR